jgi:tetratricopeptide (TPR) repeat protein
VRSLADLGWMLRALRRRHARMNGGSELTYRELAAATGWSHGIVGEYLSGRVLPPTDRFDTLIRLLGATPAEQGALATARDRIEEARRRPAADAAVPRQLPSDVFAFTGRTRELAKLSALLADGCRRSAVVISTVAGTAGVGKTALAVRWAHQVAEKFPDGQLYVDLRGYGPEPPVPPEDALAGFLRSLGVDGVQLPQDLDERAARYRTAVADRRMLVVLDNASSADQVRPLLPGTPQCFVLVTSRDSLAGLVARDGAHRIDLDVLTQDEAVSLLRWLIGSPVDGLADLADCCARLPLALRIAAAQGTTDLRTLTAELRGSPLDTLDTGDPRAAIRSVLSWSYRRLSPQSARTFRLLGLHPGSTFDVYAVAAVGACNTATARAALDELARAHLIERSPSGMFGCHDLLRAYARELAPDDPVAVTRLFDHYTSTAAAAVSVAYPHDALPGTPPASFADAPSALRWLDRQRDNLVAVALNGSPRHTVELSRTLWRYFEVGGHYQEAMAVHSAAVAAVPSDADALANLGGIHWWLGSHRDARDFLERSLAGHRHAGDSAGEARAAARLGLVYERLGRYADALSLMRSALAAYRATGDRHGEGRQLINLGTVHRRLGQYAIAAGHCREAAELFHALGERRLEGYALGNLGAVTSILGAHAEALRHLERALAYCREARDPGGEASAIATIGAVRARLGTFGEALDLLRQALDLSRAIGDRSLETETLNTLGATLLAVGEPSAALAEFRAALAITDGTGDLYEYARALDGMASATGDADHRRRALEVYRRLGVPEGSAGHPVDGDVGRG